MAVGVVTPVVPVANDIVLGEVKLYANYECPDAFELGALEGGIKLDIQRKIDEIKFDGGYGMYLDSAGIPLRRYNEFNVKVTAESLVLKYENNKIISNCETTDTGWAAKDWAATGGTYTAETTLKLKGDQSAKCVASTTLYGIHNAFVTPQNLTVFDNGETAATSDYIAFGIYITSGEITNLGTSKIRLNVHKDAVPTVTNLYYYDVVASALVAGWNVFKIAKSSFTQTGTASWSAVTGISFQLIGAPSGTTTFYVDAISLLQVVTKGTMLPINGANLTMTDQTTYKSIVGDLEITDADYFENIAIVGQKHDGKQFIVIVRDVYNDGAINLALKEKTQVVNGTEFTGHFKAGSPTTCPISIRDYTS